MSHYRDPTYLQNILQMDHWICLVRALLLTIFLTKKWENWSKLKTPLPIYLRMLNYYTTKTFFIVRVRLGSNSGGRRTLIFGKIALFQEIRSHFLGIVNIIFVILIVWGPFTWKLIKFKMKVNGALKVFMIININLLRYLYAIKSFADLVCLNYLYLNMNFWSSGSNRKLEPMKWILYLTI